MDKNAIYISGGITKVGVDEAYKIFEEYEKLLSFLFKCQIVNPMKAVPQQEGKGWLWYMVRLLPIVAKCSTIAMLPNWRDSRGARVERLFAKLLGKEIIYVELMRAGQGQGMGNEDDDC